MGVLATGGGEKGLGEGLEAECVDGLGEGANGLGAVEALGGGEATTAGVVEAAEEEMNGLAAGLGMKVDEGVVKAFFDGAGDGGSSPNGLLLLDDEDESGCCANGFDSFATLCPRADLDTVANGFEDEEAELELSPNGLVSSDEAVTLFVLLFLADAGVAKGLEEEAVDEGLSPPNGLLVDEFRVEEEEALEDEDSLSSSPNGFVVETAKGLGPEVVVEEALSSLAPKGFVSLTAGSAAVSSPNGLLALTLPLVLLTVLLETDGSSPPKGLLGDTTRAELPLVGAGTMRVEEDNAGPGCDGELLRNGLELETAGFALSAGLAESAAAAAKGFIAAFFCASAALLR